MGGMSRSLGRTVARSVSAVGGFEFESDGGGGGGDGGGGVQLSE